VHFEIYFRLRRKQRTWPGLPRLTPVANGPEPTLEHVIFGGLRLIEIDHLGVMIRTGNKRGIIDRSRNTRNALRPQRGRQCRLSVMGDGPVDIIMVPGFISHIGIPSRTARLHRSFAPPLELSHAWWRSIKEVRDLSDRVSDAPSLEQRMDDVSRHYGCYRLATSNGVRTFRRLRDGALCFAATYPERVSRLILLGAL